MTEKLPLTLVAVAVLAFACGPRQRSESGADQSPATRTARSGDAPLAPSLDVSVKDDVRFSFEIANAGSKKLELKFPDGRTHDVIVLDSLGREVWRWSEGRFFTQSVQNRVLRISDSIRFEEAWKDAAPGTYTAVATLASVNFPLEQRVAFTVR